MLSDPVEVRLEPDGDNVEPCLLERRKLELEGVFRVHPQRGCSDAEAEALRDWSLGRHGYAVGREELNGAAVLTEYRDFE